MPILITGSTGIAGRHIAAALEKRGVPTIRVARRPGEGGHSADLTEPRSVESIANFSGVVHCAGLTPRLATATWADFYGVNVVGSTLLATESVRRGAGFFLYISTGGRLGRHRSATGVTRLYVISKYLAERRIRQILRGQVPALSLRAASLYGEYDNGSMSRLIRAIARGRFLLPVRGAVPKCLLYAGTLGAVVSEEIASGPVHAWRARGIADLRSYDLAQVVAAVERAIGRRIPRLPVSPQVVSLGIEASESLSRLFRYRQLVDLSLAARTALTPVRCSQDNLLKEHPGAWVELEEGVRREAEWMRANKTL